jgi:hypothetical protein
VVVAPGVEAGESGAPGARASAVVTLPKPTDCGPVR